LNEIINRLEKAGCNVSYGIKMHLGREGFYMKDLQQLYYDDTLSKLGRAINKGNSKLCYQYATYLNNLYAGLGFITAYYVSDSIAEHAKRGRLSDIYSLYDNLCNLHERYVSIIKAV